MSRIQDHFKNQILPRLGKVKSLPGLAKELGVDVSTLRKISKGYSSNPTLAIVSALDEALCSDVDLPVSGSSKAACKSAVINVNKEGQAA